MRSEADGFDTGLAGRPRDRSVEPETDGQPVEAETPLITFVIPVFNQLELTRRCLQSIADTVGFPREVVVVDNGSTDGTGGFLDGEQVTVVSNGANLGISRATSQGIAAVRGKYVCLMNNDVTCPPGWLEPLLALLEADPIAGLAGPKQVMPDGRVWHAGTVFLPQGDGGYPGFPVHIFSGFRADDPAVNAGGEYPAMNFGCVLVKAGLFDEVGVLDDEGFAFPGYYEDVDWCLRARKCGYTCHYVSESAVLHDGGRTSTGSGDELKLQCDESGRRNLERLREKWGGEPESFFTPGDVAELVEQYVTSGVFQRERAENLVRELERAERHVDDLARYVEELEQAVRDREKTLERAKEHEVEVTAYVRKLEADWQSKCAEIEEARSEIAALEKALEGARNEQRRLPGTRP